MRVNQIINRKPADLAAALTTLPIDSADLLLVFGSLDHFSPPGLKEVLSKAFPKALLLGCSTAGEITAGGVDGWQEKRDQDTDDADHDQHFDEREGVLARRGSHNVTPAREGCCPCSRLCQLCHSENWMD